MTLHADQTSQIVDRAVDEARLGREEAEWLATHMAEPEILAILQEGAHESKCRAQRDGVSFSRNVFIPLTNLCRDRCAYCTFAKTPDSPEAKTFSLDEVASLTRGGVQMGCIEALFCLGDKPEIAYRGHKQWLAAEGFAS
ncbi:MAG: 7,8-didemethyl-8-hydroxy-5-deazariboflavin synthase, partial [Deltaproteobacteria bacterium]|nr:7,8-didemethyl-8-hydroxy-5-deazariboflavin synthase [Deltaproteobacteria bacterium]